MNQDKRQRIRLTAVVILLSVISLFPIQIIANQGGKDHKPAWPVFQHDAQHTGRSTYKGPDDPEVKWVFNGRFSTSRSYPLIGSAGTIYIVI